MPFLSKGKSLLQNTYMGIGCAKVKILVTVVCHKVVLPPLSVSKLMILQVPLCGQEKIVSS